MSDDVLIVWGKCVRFDPQDLKTFLNSIEERVQWTMDLKETRQLPFTNILISRKDKQTHNKSVQKSDSHQLYKLEVMQHQKSINWNYENFDFHDQSL